MSKTEYIDLYEVTQLQFQIMNCIEEWVKNEKTPIPRKIIIETMKEKGNKEPTIVGALNSLLAKGYIRRAVTSSNKTYYVQLRRV